MSITENKSTNVLQLIKQQRLSEARENCIRLIKQDPGQADPYFLLGIIALEMRNIPKAVELIEKALTITPENTEYLTHLAKVHIMSSDLVTAKKLADKVVTLKPTSAITLDTLGVIYSKLGLHSNAVKLFNKAIESEPENPNFLFNQATSLKFTGDFNAASAAYEKVISLAPSFYKAHSGLTSLGGITNENNHIERLSKRFDKTTSTIEQLHLSHAIAKELEALGRFDEAFIYLEKGKRARLADIDYQVEDEAPIFEALKQMFSQTIKNNSKPHKQNDNTDAPIFIVGMPRTGTTLVERIVSNHPDVVSIGESNQFGVQLKKATQVRTNRVIDLATIKASSSINFSQLGKNYLKTTQYQVADGSRFVDKMPLNFYFVGHILKSLPAAKIICLDRHPLDTCISNYRQLFSIDVPYYHYAYSLESTAKFYCMFRDLMNFWQQEFSDNFYHLNYQTLVNSPAQETEKLFNFLGLSWDHKYLEIEQNQSPIATASAVQVRSPIHNRSVGNWKKYEKQLKEIKHLLTDYLID